MVAASMIIVKLPTNTALPKIEKTPRPKRLATNIVSLPSFPFKSDPLREETAAEIVRGTASITAKIVESIVVKTATITKGLAQPPSVIEYISTN